MYYFYMPAVMHQLFCRDLNYFGTFVTLAFGAEEICFCVRVIYTVLTTIYVGQNTVTAARTKNKC